MPARIITRTVIGSALQTERGLGLEHNVLEYTTLNQAISERTIIGNLPEPLTKGMESLPAYDYRTDSDKLFTQYLCIGNGGHKNVTDSGSSDSAGFVSTPGSSGVVNTVVNGTPYTLPVPHSATDTGLYNQIPFLVREVTDDLTIAERRQYGLRRTIEKDGVLYAAYFGRKLQLDRVTPTINVTHVVDGESTTVEFVPTFNNLRPTHPTEDTSYDASYGNVSASVTVVWDEDQIQDIKDACRILYGNEHLAIISEIAICSAVEKPITQKYPNSGTQSPINVAANTFFEAVACQVVMFISTYVPISFADQEYTLYLDLGATEPLFGVSGK